MKRLVLITNILIIVALLLTACGATPEPQVIEVEKEVTRVVTEVVEVEKVITPTPEPVAEGGKIIIRVGTGDSGEGLNPHQEIIARFEEENPDILVQLEAVSGRDYYTRLLTQIAAGDAPDIMQVGDDAVPMFVDKGAFQPLDGYIDGEYPLDTSMYLPTVLQPGMWAGAQYLLPKDFTPLGVYYNKKIFDEFGVDYPVGQWTWDDMLAKAQELTRDTDGDGKTDIWGIQLTANWTTGFEYWVAASGGRLIDENGKSYVGYMDSPQVVQALQFFSDLYNVHKVAPPPADFSLWAGGNSEFDNGQAAMRIFGRWPQSGYLDNPNIDLGLIGMPAGAERSNIFFWGGFGIASTSKHPEEAWRFLKYYVGEEGSWVWKDWGIPPVDRVAEEAGMYDDPLEGVWLSEMHRVKGRAYVFTPYWGESADPALRKALETVLIDPDANVQAVLEQAAVEAQTVLDEKLAQEE